MKKSRPNEEQIQDPKQARPVLSVLKIPPDKEGFHPPRHGVIFLQVVICLFFCVFVVRFWYLQVHRGPEFARQAQENRMRLERIFAPRGRILDLEGNVLADNRTAFGLSLTREDCPDIPATLAQISHWFDLPLEDVQTKYNVDKAKIKPFEPLLMITDIDFEQVARIESELHMWPGLEIVVRTKRSYPENELFAHVLGYVGEANEKEMEADQALNLGDLVGKAGLEYKLEKDLRGNKGIYDVEVDAHARILGKKLKTEPRGGAEARLSLDKGLQAAAWRALNGETGSIVVMESDTGKLRALVTAPAYDNNLFAGGISKRDWEALRTNKRFPLQNRVIQSMYPPGSIWKLVMAGMLLENGVSSRESVHCPGAARIGRQVFRCWKRSGHGSMNMESALIHSCDVYFYKMADRMGIDKIEQFAKQAGFGALTGIDLPHEKPGLVPSKEWKKKRFKRPWSRGDTFNVSIGQGSTLITPVQMAVYVSALLNGGRLLKPQLLDGVEPEVQGELPCKPETLDFLVKAMHKTATYGTARVVSRRDAEMGGKTGTAQVVKLKFSSRGRTLRTSEMEYAQRDHAWIATWGRKDGKSYVVIVMVEHGGGGSKTAGPVAKKVYESLFGPDTGVPKKRTAQKSAPDQDARPGAPAPAPAQAGLAQAPQPRM